MPNQGNTAAAREGETSRRESHRRPDLSSIRYPELDGIRGLAILLVLAFHYVTLPGNLIAWWAAPLRIAWSGVDLFFVLSGFLIGGILIDNRDSANYFSAFYGRRAFRIFPLYFASLAIVIWFVHESDIPLWSYWLYIHNWFMQIGNRMGPTVLDPLWSLAVEEQFYLVLPMVVWLLPKRWLEPVVAVAVLASPLVRHAFDGNWRLTQCRMDSLGMGILIASAVRSPAARSWLRARMWILYGIVVVSFPLVLLTRGTTDSYGLKYLVFAFLYGAFLFAAVLSGTGSILKRALSVAPLRTVGRLSYALYILHIPVLLGLFFGLLGHAPDLHSTESIVVTALAIVVLFGIAELSWRYFESRLLAASHRRFRYVG